MSYLKLFIIFYLFFLNLNAISLTQNEKDWILKNPVIKVGVDENWPPFDFVDDKKIHKGISAEYLKLISESTGLKFEIYSDKWSNVIEKIKSKQLDILACAANTVDRREYLQFTQNYLSADIVVVARKDIKIKEFDDVRNYIVALPQGNFVHEKLKNRFPKLKFRFVKSNEEALRDVSYGKADIYIGNLPVVSYYMDKYLLTNLEIKFKSDFESAKLSIAIQKTNDVLFGILQKALLSISPEKKRELNKKWIFEFTKKPKYLENKLGFNSTELNWINKNKTIKIAGDIGANPFSFLGEKGEYIGIVPDIIKLIEEKSDLKFEYTPTKSWSESLLLMKNGDIDLLDYTTFTQERSSFMNFSTPYLGVDYVIIGRVEQNNYISNIEKIIDKYKVGAVQDYAVSEMIKKDYPSIQNFREYHNPEDGLKALSIHQIDYFIMNIPSFEYYSKKSSLTNLKIVGPTGYSFESGLGVTKEKKTLLSIINKVLESITKSEIDKIYRKWVKIEVEEKIDYDLLWKVVLISFLILFAILFWNRKLKNEVEERKLAQTKLSKSRDFINAIMNSQLDIIVVTDGIEVKQVNKAFFDVLKFKDIKDFKKNYKCICDLFDTSEKEFLAQEVNGVKWIDEVLDNPTKSYRAKIFIDGEEHIFKVAASLIKSENLKMAVFHDITELENLNKDLVFAKNKAESAAKHKSEFLANMSHEIRTPMNSVIGFTELLDKEIIDPVQKDYLASIKKGGNALLGIINDILDLSKIEAGKLEIKNESINPRNLILEMESIFHSKIISKNINFEVEIDETIPPFIIIDSIRIRQVLFNLIGNAIKFTEQGSVKLVVQNIYKDDIKSKIDLIISVEDTGIGIDKDHLKSIFNAFEQTSSGTKYGGTGLGLAICSKLVQMMNGKIEVESKKGYGSSFKVFLRDIPVSSIGEKIEVQKLDHSNIKFEKATILVVDDILENRKLVQASLKDFNFELIVAENGQEALERLNDIKIDLILMDLRMPIMDGYKAASIIKDDEKLKFIPLVALTASVMGKDLEKVKKYGFDAYLRKPVILGDLIEKISEFLPYDFIENKVAKESIDLEKIDLVIFEKVINRLQTDLKYEWDSIRDKGDFILIDEFALKLKELVKECNVEILTNYANDLRTYIESFDIEKVDFLMNSYEEMIEKLIKVKEQFD